MNFFEISKNTFLTEHLWATVSELQKFAIGKKKKLQIKLGSLLTYPRSFITWMTRHFFLLFACANSPGAKCWFLYNLIFRVIYYFMISVSWQGPCHDNLMLPGCFLQATFFLGQTQIDPFWPWAKNLKILFLQNVVMLYFILCQILCWICISWQFHIAR